MLFLIATVLTLCEPVEPGFVVLDEEEVLIPQQEILFDDEDLEEPIED